MGRGDVHNFLLRGMEEMSPHRPDRSVEAPLIGATRRQPMRGCSLPLAHAPPRTEERKDVPVDWYDTTTFALGSCECTSQNVNHALA